MYIFITIPFDDTKSAMPCAPRLMYTFFQIVICWINGTDVIFFFVTVCVCVRARGMGVGVELFVDFSKKYILILIYM